MVEITNSILYVGTPGVDNNCREHALVASGIGVASVESPESALSYVKNSGVSVVVLEDTGNMDVPLLASCLKVANPFVRVIALTNDPTSAPYVDTPIAKPVSIDILLKAIRYNLALSGIAAHRV
ncbi:response regulator receiver protein [Candidatus Koribacter versatilis Ellin345]|uniref:Response regulator receiver protein n=1 Tax=Koribacter versatilis (strain Ellin345) TaxID=204669 RepID=Q1IJM4_KORVE|nr:transcriptional regulator [Candidatus Koribacter versatilis]ABF42926.1 response regulator receiver protein [Candidatus Koribacter versatilis Ellin345]